MSPATPRVEQVGRRFYALDWPRAENAYLKSCGAHWDAEKRGWWVAKADTAAAWQQRLERQAAGAAERRAASEQAVAAAHAAGVCTWTKVGQTWVITGPEAALRSGTVTVQARGKAPAQVRVYNVRRDGDRWIANEARDTRPRSVASRAPGSHRPRELPFVGAREGATLVLERRYRGQPDLDSIVGDTMFYSEKRGDDPIVVIAIGAEAHYTTEDDEDDFGQPGTPSGWWVKIHARVATEVEAAPLLAEATREREAADARARAEAEAIAHFQARRAELTAGLVRVPEAKARVIEQLAVSRDRMMEIAICRAELPDGRPCIVETTTAGDDWRSAVLVPRELGLELLRMQLAEMDQRAVADGREPLTATAAAEWLAKYSGCYGAEIYRLAAGLDPFEKT